MDSTKEYYLIACKWWGLVFSVKLFGSEGHVIDIHWIIFFLNLHTLFDASMISTLSLKKYAFIIMADV